MPEGDYSLDRIQDRVDAAKAVHADYVKRRLRGYDQRSRRRKKLGLHVIAYCGHGRAGKDTAAEFMAGAYGAVYGGSLSGAALPIIAEAAGVPPAQAWAERHQRREFWLAGCHALRGGDYTLLLRMSLGEGDSVAGIRGRLELDAAAYEGVVYRSLWVDNRRVAVDPTVEYEAGDCDLAIPNHGSYREFYSKLRRFAALLQR